MKTYIVTTKDGFKFTVTAYSNFHAAAKAQSIGGPNIKIEEVKS